MEGAKEYLMGVESRGPLIIVPSAANSNLAEVVLCNLSTIEHQLLEHGALLFRGFDVRSTANFDAFVDAIGHARLRYVYRSTPRTEVSKGIFTATEYPSDQEIPLHCENSYQRIWPLKVALCCLVPAKLGGETPIADMRKVTAAINRSLLDKFEQLGVRYIRHYHPYIDLPWQKVFQTDDRTVLAEYCVNNNIDYMWLDANTLRTSQVCQGTARHPVTEERIFFNQSHLFHISSLGSDAAKLLIETFGADRLPRQACYGDGREIPIDDLAIVRAAFLKGTVTFKWEAGDILLLDNMQFAHGRRSFKGARQVLAALLQPNDLRWNGFPDKPASLAAVARERNEIQDR